MAGAISQHTAKFTRRRTEILDTASKLINVHGVRGMTLTAVARELGLDTSSVTYYFKRKDLLAAACIQRTLDWLTASARAAAAEPDPRARTRHFLHEQFALLLRQRDPAVPELALLSDMSTLDDEARAPLDAAYAEIARIVRHYFDAPRNDEGRSAAVRSTVVLMSNVHWLPAWLDRYMGSDLARVEARLFDVLDRGIAPGLPWPTTAVPLEEAAEDPQGRFLHAATNLINSHGYLGASVERIAGELGVSTGSFYHHIDNKDDLVVTCFNRSFSMVKRARAVAASQGGTEGEQLARMIASLIALQFAGASPMLRNSAYQALPVELRQVMLGRTGQVTRHIAGRVSDAIADGSVRAIDPVVTGHVIMSAINGAADLRRWIEGRPIEAEVSAYCEVLRSGIFID